MIFHLLTDNPVYIDTFISKADSISEEENCYVLIKDGKIKNIKYKEIYQTDLQGAIKKFQQEKISKIVIHYLNGPIIDFINKAVIDVPVYWMFWGGDGYKHPELKKNLYLPKTSSIIKKSNPRRGLKALFDEYRAYTFKNKLEKSLKKIDFCCTQIKGDYDLIMNAVPNLTMQHKYFAYSGVNYKNENLALINKSGNKLKLLVGNSANPTNNHIDVLSLLKEYDLHIESIICPLSYAGSKEYIQEVINFGKKTFGNKFIPLTEFLALDKYQNLIESMDVAIFYHTRQQGFSNTIMMLENNKKILMNSNSTLYKMYSEFGIENVFSNFDSLINSEPKRNYKLYSLFTENIIDQWYKDILNK